MANSIGLMKQEKVLEDIPLKVSCKEEVDIKDEPLEVNEDEHSTEKVEEIQVGKNDIDKVEDMTHEVNDNDDEELDIIPHKVSEDNDNDEEGIDNSQNIMDKIVHGQQSKPTESHHVCYICKKTFASLGAMKQHIRNHIGDSPMDQEIGISEEMGMSEEMASLMAQATKDQDTAMVFLFDVGCLHSTPPNGCDVEGCVTPMNFRRNKGKCVWKCFKHKRIRSIRYGSILDKTHVPMDRWLKVAFIWACDIDIKTARNSILHRRNTIFNWKDFFRTICSRHFVRNPIRIGGREEVVQIDTFVYKTRNRTKKGGMNIKNYFVGYCPATPEGFIFVVPDFEEETLIPIIKKHILPGSVIHSDPSPVFMSIPELNIEPAFSHVTVESTDDFVCPVTGEHVNYAELFYRKHEEKYVEMFGMKGEKFQSYLDELMWRDRYGQSQKTALENLFLHIKELNNL